MSSVLICTSDSNVIRNNNNILVHKRKLKHLAKLAQCGEFDCVFLSCHIRVLERIFNLQLFECEGTSSSKHLTLKWPKRDSNPQLFSSWTNTQPFSQTGQIIELCCEYRISDSNGIQTHNNLNRKGTRNHLAKLAKYGEIGSVFLPYHIRVLEGICNL